MRRIFQHFQFFYILNSFHLISSSVHAFLKINAIIFKHQIKELILFPLNEKVNVTTITYHLFILFYIFLSTNKRLNNGCQAFYPFQLQVYYSLKRDRKKNGKKNDGTNANDKRFILLFPIRDSYKINPSDLANRKGKYKHSNDSR